MVWNKIVLSRHCMHFPLQQTRLQPTGKLVFIEFVIVLLSCVRETDELK